MDQSNCIELFKTARKFKSDLFAGSSQSISDDLIKVHISLIDESRNIIKLTIEDDYIPLLAEIVSGSNLLDLQLVEQSIIATVPIVEIIKKKTIIAELPIFFRFLDRRDHHRARENNLPCDVSLNSSGVTIKSRRCYDVSNMGLSVVVNQSEFKIIKKREETFELTLEFRDEVIKTYAEMLRFTALSPFDYDEYPYGGVKISFRFEKKNDSIQKVINEHTLRR